MTMHRWLALAICVLLVGSVNASTPELGAVLPVGGQRGAEMTINFHGARLADAQQVVTYGPGIDFQKLEVVNPAHVKAIVKIAPDCRLGEHPLRLRCASGHSVLRTFWVGALPIVEEKEANNEFGKPQPVPMNCTVQGVITGEDVDYFSVEAKKGQRLSVEIEGMRLGRDFFDPAIAVLNEKRFELATSDDTPLLRQDAHLSVVIPEDGKYIIRVRESAYGGTPSSHYRLHVGAFPRPTTVFPLGGRPGEEIEVTYLGDALGDVKKKIKPPNDGRMWFEDAGGISPSDISFRIVDLPNVNEVEPNDAMPQATVVQVPCAFNGIISKPNDHDQFRFAAKKGQTFDIRCWSRKLGSPLDPVMWIVDATGKYLTGADDSEGSPDPYFRFTASEDKEYVIVVRDHLMKGGPSFTYRIEVTTIEPRIATALYKYGLPPTQERQSIDVPKGNRNAVLVTSARADFGGELALTATGLPEKMTAAPVKMHPGLTGAIMVFESAADAPIAGRLATIDAKPVDANIKAGNAFFQDVELVFGQNITIFSKLRVNQLAAAVTEAVPFSIKIIEPKVPIVRNGIQYLKVVAERRDGHKAAIHLEPLYNPPGVAANVVQIPEGQTEALMTLTANGSSAVGKWPFVVMANSAAKDGPAWVSSQLATVEVAVQPVTIALDRATTEQGKPVSLHGKVAVATPWAGPAKVRMVGLPNKVVATDIDLPATAADVSIPVTIDPASPAGQHKNLICQVTIQQNGEQMVYTAGVGELRIDAPLPAKPNQPAVAAQPKSAAPAKTEKPLSRLEQLRKEQQEREKGDKP